jgi:hypothetical protein
MLRKWEYNFSKEAKTFASTESKFSSLVKQQISVSTESQAISASMGEAKQSQSGTSTQKILSLVFKAETESFSPVEPWSKATLDGVLNELFDVYYEALKMGSMASLEPFDKVVARVAETRIVDPVSQGNPIATRKDHFWKKSYSVVATASESEQSNQSESSSRLESNNKVIKI